MDNIPKTSYNHLKMYSNIIVNNYIRVYLKGLFTLAIKHQFMKNDHKKFVRIVKPKKYSSNERNTKYIPKTSYNQDIF